MVFLLLKTNTLSIHVSSHPTTEAAWESAWQDLHDTEHFDRDEINTIIANFESDDSRSERVALSAENRLYLAEGREKPLIYWVIEQKIETYTLSCFDSEGGIYQRFTVEFPKEMMPHLAGAKAYFHFLKAIYYVDWAASSFNSICQRFNKDTGMNAEASVVEFCEWFVHEYCGEESTDHTHFDFEPDNGSFQVIRIND
jgi:hypothetical protein